MANKTWNEVHAELMKNPDFVREHEALKGRMERVMLYHNARTNKGLSPSAIARGAGEGVKYSTVLALEDDNIPMEDIDSSQVERINAFLGIN